MCIQARKPEESPTKIENGGFKAVGGKGNRTYDRKVKGKIQGGVGVRR